MPPRRGGICGRLTSDLPSTRGTCLPRLPSPRGPPRSSRKLTYSRKLMYSRELTCLHRTPRMSTYSQRQLQNSLLSAQVFLPSQICQQGLWVPFFLEPTKGSSGTHGRSTGIATVLIPSFQGFNLPRVINSGLVGYRESRRCSRDTYQESNLTKYTSIRREMDSQAAIISVTSGGPETFVVHQDEVSSSLLLLSNLELSDAKSLWALNTSPSRNCLTFLRSSCS